MEQEKKKKRERTVLINGMKNGCAGSQRSHNDKTQSKSSTPSPLAHKVIVRTPQSSASSKLLKLESLCMRSL